MIVAQVAQFMICGPAGFAILHERNVPASDEKGNPPP
jgi:hypothetical protein